MSLNPKEIIFAMDEGLDINIIQNNIKNLKPYMKLKDTKIKYWDYESSKYILKDSKSSITDLGHYVFEKIINEEIVEDM